VDFHLPAKTVDSIDKLQAYIVLMLIYAYFFFLYKLDQKKENLLGIVPVHKYNMKF